MFRDIIQSNRWLVPGFTAVAGVLAFLQFGWWGVLAFVVVLLLFAVVALGVYASRLRSRLPPALEAPTGAPDEGDRNDKALEEEAAPPSLADRESQRKADTDEGAANDVVVADGAPNLSLEIRADIAARRGNLRDVREVTERWIDEAETDAQRLERRARGLVWESKAGSPDALAALRTLSDENPASSAACLGLAFALRELGEPERGANEIIARISSLEPEDQASASAQAALFLRQAGKPEASLDVARRALATEPLTREHEATLRNQIGLVLYELDRRVEALAHLEHAISLNPSDRSRRWDLAYKYSESGYREPATVHYLALEEGGTSMTLNNLGASFGSLDLGLAAVSYYKRAVEIGNARAAGNLAFLSLEAGFGEQAADWISKGVKHEQGDDRVAAANVRLTGMSAKEDDALKAIRDRGQDIRRAIEDFMEPSESPPIGTWEFSTGQVFSLIEKDGFTEGKAKSGGSEVTLRIQKVEDLLEFTWRTGVLQSVERRGIGVARDGFIQGIYQEKSRAHVFTATHVEDNGQTGAGAVVEVADGG